MAAPLNIYLIGMPGSGKTSSGKALADLLGFAFVDLDEIIVQNASKSIADIFESEGEPKFREYETAALKSVVEKTGQVIATGGGLVTQEENWDLMKASGRSIHLKTSPEWVYKRTSSSNERPLLNNENPKEQIKMLHGMRSELYGQADLEVETDGKKAKKVAEEIYEKVK